MRLYDTDTFEHTERHQIDWDSIHRETLHFKSYLGIFHKFVQKKKDLH